MSDNTYGDNHYQAFVHGYVMLKCNLSCAFRWGEALEEMRSLYDSGKWNKLASKVMEIGYENNLGYFYLGRAAESLGYDYAAFRYFGLGRGAPSCGGDCGGFVFPKDLDIRKNEVARRMGQRSIKEAEARAAADKVKAEAEEKARAEAAQAQRVAALKATTAQAYQQGKLAIPAGFEQLVVDHFKAQGYETPPRQGPMVFPKDYRGDSIVDLVQRFDSLDKLADDEFTKTSTVAERASALTGKRYRFVFAAHLNQNFSAFTKTADAAQYDADAEVMRVVLWSRDRRILLGKGEARGQGYTTINLFEKSSSRDYVGQNAFGVKADVHSMVVQQYGLALTNFPPNPGGGAQQIFATALDLPPSAARALKSDLVFYVDAVLSPQNPAIGSVLKDAAGHDATIKDPTSIYIGGSYLVAAIKEVGVFRKSTGQVLAWRTYP
ncbi:hypothetical protein [Cupriavidus yeoncheonensis]|uniref:hypothetical protein n=1 Tax=Cupriavidus yeoncheonensis TaxID=1462994 RepID=UPI001BAABFD9|nr:hypothetical protein [Cupriavidus yeoncheonensis]